MKRKSSSAFTLIELMVAMGIIGILLTMSIVGISIVQQSLRNTQRRDALNSLNLAINSYYGNFGTFPSNTDIRFTQTAIFLANNKIVDLSGATKASATLTSDQFTQYCFNARGGSYDLGANLEGNAWGLQLGNSGTRCTTPNQVN